MILRARLSSVLVSLSCLLGVACGDPDADGGRGDSDAVGADGVVLTVLTSGSGSGSVATAGDPPTDGSPLACASGQDADCVDAYAPGAHVTLTASADADAVFVGWSGACTGADPTCGVTLDAATTVTATFDLVEDPLQVTVTGTGAGTVTSSPEGIDCGSAGSAAAACSDGFARGTEVTLTATAEPDSLFAGWSGACTGSEPTCRVTVDRARDVTAQFDLAADPVHVTLAGTGAGTVTSTPAGIACGNFPGAPTACSEDVDPGTALTLTASPSSSSTFAGWSGACTGTASCELEVDEATEVTATFDVIEDTLDVTLSGTGIGAVTSDPAGIDCGDDAGAPHQCSGAFARTTVVTLTATPKSGHEFKGWTSGCTGTSATCQVTMTQATSVGAKFDVVYLTAPLVSAVGTATRSQGQIQVLGLEYYIAASGATPSPSGPVNTSDKPYVGQIMLFAGASAPAGWVPCDGSLLLVVQNPDLYAVLGTTFGGNGTSTFAVPDLRDRVPLGAGTLQNPSPNPTSAGTSLVPVVSGLFESEVGQGQVGVLGLNWYVATAGSFPGLAPTHHFWVSQVMLFAGGSAPAGWHLADGALLPVASYLPLFSVIGTTYGGNGTTDFALPDLRGRVPMGMGTLPPSLIPTSTYRVPLVSSIARGGTAEGQVGVVGLRHLLVEDGVFPGGTLSNAYTGQIVLLAGAFTPTGWATADGALVTISSHTALYAVFGTVYGGDGHSNFGIPDLGARAAMGIP